MPFDFDANDLCYTSPFGGVICRAPHRTKLPSGDEVVGWFDSDHHRLFNVKKVTRDDDSVFSFEDKSGRKFTLRPLDLQSWKKISDAFPGAPKFKSTNDLREFFLVDGVMQ